MQAEFAPIRQRFDYIAVSSTIELAIFKYFNSKFSANGPPESDVAESLLHRAAAGEAKAHTELWDQFRGRLRTMVAIRLDHRIANRVDASDIVQEALAQAFVRLPKYLEDRQIPFYPWLRRIACDRLSDAYRVHVLAKKRSVLYEQHEFLPVNGDSMTNLAANVASVCYDPQQHSVQASIFEGLKLAPGTQRGIALQEFRSRYTP